MSTKQLNKHLEAYMTAKGLRQYKYNLVRYTQARNVKKPYTSKDELFADLDEFAKTLVRGVKL
jgi:hypothetical protein